MSSGGPFSAPDPPAQDVDDLAAAIRDAGLTLASLNLFAGDLTSGERGVLSHPDRAAELTANLPVAVGLAAKTGCTVLHALYGNVRSDLPPGVQDEHGVSMFHAAIRAASEIGATVVIEAMNPADAPMFPLHSTAAALRLIERVEERTGAHLGILYDAYHMQRAEGDLISTIRSVGHRFTHVQIADAPDRTPPGTGEIAYPRVLAALEETGYGGYVGLEYRPVGSSTENLAWASRWQDVEPSPGWCP